MMKKAPVYPDVIVELGINHNGSLDMAFDMLYSLRRVVSDYPGSVYAKTQKRTPRLSVPKEMWNKPRIHPGTGQEMTYIEYKEQMEFSVEDHAALRLDAYELGFADYFASVWDEQAVADMIASGANILKIPSAKLTNHKLIHLCSLQERPIILSTGMSTMIEIAEAASYIDDPENSALLVTTSTYPCPDEEIGLGRIGEMRKRFPNFGQIGFSSHSISPFPLIYATVAGADVVEFHYTLDRSLPGSDQSSSLELPAVELIMRELQRVPKLFLHDIIGATPSELSKMKELRG